MVATMEKDMNGFDKTIKFNRSHSHRAVFSTFFYITERPIKIRIRFTDNVIEIHRFISI